MNDFWKIAGIVAAVLACAVYFVALVLPVVRDVWDRSSPALRRLFMLWCLLFTTYAGGKGFIARITYPRTDPEVWYLRDNGSYVKNDAVHVAFTRNLIVPDSAMFYLYGLESSYTNETDWTDNSFCAYSNSFAAITVPFDFAYPTASNFNWLAFTDWTPSPQTHTNGVAYVSWQIGSNKPTNNVALIRTGVYANALRIAPNPAITNGVPLDAASRSIMEVKE